VVERVDKFENDFIGERGWWFDVEDVLVNTLIVHVTLCYL